MGSAVRHPIDQLRLIGDFEARSLKNLLCHNLGVSLHLIEVQTGVRPWPPEGGDFLLKVCQDSVRHGDSEG
jgi:hypothetical protein